ncbi:prepilin-type N-terminal cleavage/methylation domain-containing protein [Vibrio tritonius]|uniref:Prepilin-type N-terminal cleavage/methylation domain-containing protein n=1 Tax=Vibrio tritonius TaxID=1435069 RepID=A0ABS7YHS9_9VIBR|nr:prepilin-type N-terminal cleavage/methylation domain-containing protein [Vibrio tritonius]MCA2014512.1 prepilin-type N-terminal cleavage/methylation domain-containing protein [Vibrio tritonius]
MNHKQRGLSLIEVLVSMTLISVTLLTLMKAHLYLQQHSQYARQAIAAQALAENKLQQWRLWQLPEVSEDVWLRWGDGEEQVDGYVVSWQVESQLSGLVKNVEMSVSWQERSGKEQSMTFFSQFSRRGHTSD